MTAATRFGSSSYFAAAGSIRSPRWGSKAYLRRRLARILDDLVGHDVRDELGRNRHFATTFEKERNLLIDPLEPFDVEDFPARHHGDVRTRGRNQTGDEEDEK